tara:strand:+ start:259 stop:447 length:189 start_codon:yes stop_codon:yes gene_type:complete
MRKIIQIAFEPFGEMDSGCGSIEVLLHALCDDGSIWFFQDKTWNRWTLPPIPQEEAEVCPTQ